jgi:LysR family glycine cleavage system transcriptional activator
MSFAQAAGELNVTPAALSFQIKSLEDHLGQKLFHRLNRAVELTRAGRTLAPGAADGFQTLAAAWRATQKLQDETTLNVTAGPAFTAKWLAPRLYEFVRAHPEVDLKFSASLKIMDFDRDEIDVAIRFGYGPDLGLFSKPLPRDWFTPVMTPELAERYPTPASLCDAPLVFDESVSFLTPPCNWPTWFRANGIDHNPQHGARFSNGDHALDAAIAGAGIALGRRALVVKDLHDGRLVAPYPIAIQSEARFRFLCQQGAETRPSIRAFLDWILAETAITAYITDTLTIIPVEDIFPT